MDQPPELDGHGAKEEKEKFVKQSFTERTWWNGHRFRKLSIVKPGRRKPQPEKGEGRKTQPNEGKKNQ